MNLEIHNKATLRNIRPSKFSHMISVGDPGYDLSQLRPEMMIPDAQLCLNFRDRKTAGRSGAPTIADIMPLYRWLEDVGNIDRLLVHCGAGMSRSPAIALLVVCWLNPNSDVFTQMNFVSKCCSSSYIWPNPLIIELGDQITRSNGKMVAGVDRWRQIVDPDFIPNKPD